MILEDLGTVTHKQIGSRERITSLYLVILTKILVVFIPTDAVHSHLSDAEKTSSLCGRNIEMLPL